jgi:hypothetical protein
MTAIRRNTHLEFLDVEVGGDGDVQVFDIKYSSGRKMRLVNVYDQLRQVEGVRSQGRPVQTARWREIMRAKKILLGGDWNAHSDRWDPQCPGKRDEVLLTNHMDEYDLTEVTGGEVTHVCNRNDEVLTSLIDFFITKAEMAGGLEISTDLTTTSDYAVVRAQLRWDEGEGVKVYKKIMEWDIDDLKGDKKNYDKAQKQWEEKSRLRSILNKESSGEELQDEAEWIQQNFVNHLDRCCKKIRVCARSKRWWNGEIAENRKILGSIKRARKRGEVTQQQVKAQRSNL